MLGAWAKDNPQGGDVMGTLMFEAGILVGLFLVAVLVSMMNMADWD